MSVLSLSSFADKLRVVSDTFALGEGDIRTARTRGGLLVRSENGARLWGGSVTLIANRVENQREISALLARLQESDQFFLIDDLLAQYPTLDSDGSEIASASPVLSSISSDGRSIGISGLPSGYKLRRGDRFAFTYGSSPTRYALHEICDAATASAGAVSDLRVVPAIRPGVSTGKALGFARPACLAAIVPGSVKMGARSLGVGEGASFDWVQTLAGA